MTSPSEQFILDIGPLARPTLENFVVGRNRQVLGTLQSFRTLPPAERYIHLYGAPGSGRSHLLRALAEAEGGRYIAPGDDAKNWQFAEGVALFAIDDVHRTSEAEQGLLFMLINEARAIAGLGVVTAGDQPPLALKVREDVRTRLGWGLVFQLEALDDADLDAALCAHASQLGLSLGADVRRYLLTHCERNLGFLTQLVTQLDRHALSSHRQVTLPLLRNFLDDKAQGSHGP
jgi:DnaA family protein